MTLTEQEQSALQSILNKLTATEGTKGELVGFKGFGTGVDDVWKLDGQIMKVFGVSVNTTDGLAKLASLALIGLQSQAQPKQMGFGL